MPMPLWSQTLFDRRESEFKEHDDILENCKRLWIYNDELLLTGAIVIVRGVRRSGPGFYHLASINPVTSERRFYRVARKGVSQPMVIQADVDWMRRHLQTEATLVQFHSAQEDEKFSYLVLTSGQANLTEVMQIENIAPFDRRQIKEIAQQLMRALTYLHGLGVVHTDLRPENIMFVDTSTVEQMRYHADGDFFISQRSLCTTRLKLGFFGSIGTQGCHSMGKDSYRSPELVAGLETDGMIDLFALGCVLAEAYLRRPLFPSCESEPEYVLAKLTTIQKVLGDYPLHFADAVSESCVDQVVFQDNGELEALGSVSSGLRWWMLEAEPLERLIADSDLVEVILRLCTLDRHRRPRMTFLMEEYAFFQ